MLYLELLLRKIIPSKDRLLNGRAVTDSYFSGLLAACPQADFRIARHTPAVGQVGLERSDFQRRDFGVLLSGVS